MLQAEIHISPKNQESPMLFCIKGAKETKVAGKKSQSPWRQAKVTFFQ